MLDEDLYNSPEVQALKVMGHPVHLAGIDALWLDQFDLILGRKAWYMDTKHLPYLEKIALPAARKRQDNRDKERA